MPRTSSGKTLPCFAPFDAGARSGGFVGDRFLTGVSVCGLRVANRSRQMVVEYCNVPQPSPLLLSPALALPAAATSQHFSTLRSQ